jgi:hypothetical protein
MTILLDQVQNECLTLQNQPNHRRNGKIARLPKETRDLLNRMLDDGLPYRVIIDELGEGGSGLNCQNITNWVQGGYQDYLRLQEAIHKAKLQTEFAADFLRETGPLDPALLSQALNLVAGTQLFDALRKHGDQALENMFRDRPARYFQVLHAVCRQSNTAVKLKKHRTPASPDSTQIKVNQAPES